MYNEKMFVTKQQKKWTVTPKPIPMFLN